MKQQISAGGLRQKLNFSRISIIAETPFKIIINFRYNWNNIICNNNFSYNLRKSLIISSSFNKLHSFFFEPGLHWRRWRRWIRWNETLLIHLIHLLQRNPGSKWTEFTFSEMRNLFFLHSLSIPFNILFVHSLTLTAEGKSYFPNLKN